MQQIKKTADYIVFQKQSGRYAVKGKKSKQWINGEEKQAILVAEELIKLPEPKTPTAEPEAQTEASA